MALTRRQFIKRTGIVGAASFFGPALLRSPLLQKALADVIGDRYFVVLFLDGGNDGLNTVIPYDNGGGTLRTDYEAARNAGGGGLRIAPGSLLVPNAPGWPLLDPNTGAQLGFHPGLAGIHSLYEDGLVAVIQGCGYPRYDLSHDVSSSIWESGDPLKALSGTTGWMGRYLTAYYGANDIPAVCVRSSVAGEFLQTGTSVLAIQRLNRFGFPFDTENDYEDDETAKRAAFQALYGAAAGGSHPVLALLGNSGISTLISADAYPPLHGAYTAARSSWNDLYEDLGTSTARDLRELAKIIFGIENDAPNVHARFFELRNGGYDTHSDQGGAEPEGQHYRLLAEVGDALELFYDDLADMQPGLENKVTTLVWSEFSRRIPQNDNGTDHGSQGPLLVIGGAVNGGIYGNHPNIAEAALDDNGNSEYSQAGSFRSTDIRDVYGTVLKHWLNLPNPATVLPADAGDPTQYWTSPDFDLPFLP
jgi:uncharacterized protein (DUF1501 family)